MSRNGFRIGLRTIGLIPAIPIPDLFRLNGRIGPGRKTNRLKTSFPDRVGSATFSCEPTCLAADVGTCLTELRTRSRARTRAKKSIVSRRTGNPAKLCDKTRHRPKLRHEKKANDAHGWGLLPPRKLRCRITGKAMLNS